MRKSRNPLSQKTSFHISSPCRRRRLRRSHRLRRRRYSSPRRRWFEESKFSSLKNMTKKQTPMRIYEPYSSSVGCRRLHAGNQRANAWEHFSLRSSKSRGVIGGRSQGQRERGDRDRFRSVQRSDMLHDSRIQVMRTAGRAIRWKLLHWLS